MRGTTVVALAASLAAGLAAAPASAADAVDTLRAQGYGTMADVIEQSGLVFQLREKGPFTILAPTDDAFAAALAQEGMADLTAPENAETLFRVLQYHVIPGAYAADEMTDWHSLHTLHGNAVVVVEVADEVRLNNAGLVETDVETDNGVIHGIDVVLLPTAMMP